MKIRRILSIICMCALMFPLTIGCGGEEKKTEKSDKTQAATSGPGKKRKRAKLLELQKLDKKRGAVVDKKGETGVTVSRMKKEQTETEQEGSEEEKTEE